MGGNRECSRLETKAKALEKLASLEYQTGLLPSAEKHFQSAADSLATALPSNLPHGATSP